MVPGGREQRVDPAVRRAHHRGPSRIHLGHRPDESERREHVVAFCEQPRAHLRVMLGLPPGAVTSVKPEWSWRAAVSPPARHQHHYPAPASTSATPGFVSCSNPLP